MRRWSTRRVRLALGSDSHAVIDLFEEARAVELDERLATGERGHHGAAELLRAATAERPRLPRLARRRRIEPGARADLVTVGLTASGSPGTDAETALESVVFAASAADVRHVLVDGKPIVGGRSPHRDRRRPASWTTRSAR